MWKSYGAAVQGKNHERIGLPCQDAVYTLEQKGVQVVALADGAGSAAYAQEGAQCAVVRVAQVLCDRFDRLMTEPSRRVVHEMLLYPVQEALNVTARSYEAPLREVACTLLAVAVRGDDYLVVHVGDGVIGCWKEGNLKVASAPERGEFANTTTFVTSSDALVKLQVLRGTQPKLDGFILMSDGCELSLLNHRDGALAPCVGDLFRRGELFAPTPMEDYLKTLLWERIRGKTGDDCSLVLLCRCGDVRKKWDRMSQSERARLLGVFTRNRNRRRRAIRRYTKMMLL